MKTAVVTGSSSGIGKAISDLLLQNGYKVYGISRSKSSFENKNFIWIRTDLTKISELSRIPKFIKEGKINILVNNAGVAFEKKSMDFDKETFQKMYDINFHAPILLTKELKKKLSGGLVVNISSVSDRLTGENYALYCSSKAALNIYFDVVAREEKRTKFISILPSYVDTKLLRKLQKPDFPWANIVKPEQIAEFLITLIGNNKVSSGSKIIIVSDAFKEDLEYKENLWGYNVTTKNLFELKQ